MRLTLVRQDDAFDIPLKAWWKSRRWIVGAVRFRMQLMQLSWSRTRHRVIQFGCRLLGRAWIHWSAPDKGQVRFAHRELTAEEMAAWRVSLAPPGLSTKEMIAVAREEVLAQFPAELPEDALRVKNCAPKTWREYQRRRKAS